MKCPYCNHERDKVVDSRSCKDGRAVRRRRKCLNCDQRYTTYEYVETVPLSVVKKDNSREPFDRQKVLNGILNACKKRPISMDTIEEMVDSIENDLSTVSFSEVESLLIGQKIMEQLYKIDQVAYVRFASVYRNFKDCDEFVTEVKELSQRK